MVKKNIHGVWIAFEAAFYFKRISVMVVCLVEFALKYVVIIVFILLFVELAEIALAML